MIMIIMLMIVIRRRMGEGQDEVEEGDEGQRCSRGSRMGGAERADDGGNGEGERRKFLVEGRTVRGGGGGHVVFTARDHDEEKGMWARRITDKTDKILSICRERARGKLRTERTIIRKEVAEGRTRKRNELDCKSTEGRKVMKEVRGTRM